MKEDIFRNQPRPLVEICAGDLRSALQAAEGGADRVELCDRLEVGGTTPGAGTIAEACRRLTIPVHVLIRVRAGDFVELFGRTMPISDVARAGGTIDYELLTSLGRRYERRYELAKK